MIYMTKYLSLTILIFLALSTGCVSPGAKKEGASRLERLQGGISMREVIDLLGPATTIATIQESPRSEKY